MGSKKNEEKDGFGKQFCHVNETFFDSIFNKKFKPIQHTRYQNSLEHASKRQGKGLNHIVNSLYISEGIWYTVALSDKIYQKKYFISSCENQIK